MIFSVYSFGHFNQVYFYFHEQHLGAVWSPFYYYYYTFTVKRDLNPMFCDKGGFYSFKPIHSHDCKACRVARFSNHVDFFPSHGETNSTREATSRGLFRRDKIWSIPDGILLMKIQPYFCQQEKTYLYSDTSGMSCAGPWDKHPNRRHWFSLF